MMMSPHRVLCFDRRGVWLRSWGLPGTGADQLNAAVRGMTVSPTSGELFAAADRVIDDDDGALSSVRVQVFI